jgi:hypothetical protein
MTLPRFGEALLTPGEHIHIKKPVAEAAKWKNRNPKILYIVQISASPKGVDAYSDVSLRGTKRSEVI